MAEMIPIEGEDAEMSATLYHSVPTVKTHVSRILA